jgi:hypothetical protein
VETRITIPETPDYKQEIKHKKRKHFSFLEIDITNIKRGSPTLYQNPNKQSSNNLLFA